MRRHGETRRAPASHPAIECRIAHEWHDRLATCGSAGRTFRWLHVTFDIMRIGRFSPPLTAPDPKRPFRLAQSGRPRLCSGAPSPFVTHWFQSCDTRQIEDTEALRVANIRRPLTSHGRSLNRTPVRSLREVIGFVLNFRLEGNIARSQSR